MKALIITCLNVGLTETVPSQHRSMSFLYCCNVGPGLPGRSESSGMSGRLPWDTVENMTYEDRTEG